MIPVPAGRPEIFPLSGLSADSHSLSANLGPSIVIGLGDTGALALCQWLEQTAHYENGSFDNVHVLSLSVSNQKPLPQRWLHVRQIAFAEGNSDKNLNPLDAFRQAAFIRRFREWLRSALVNMRDIQVFIVASAAEPEISLLGPILQILRASPDSSISPYLNITALLSLSSAKLGGGIPQGESDAALREINHPQRVDVGPDGVEELDRAGLAGDLHLHHIAIAVGVGKGGGRRDGRGRDA